MKKLTFAAAFLMTVSISMFSFAGESVKSSENNSLYTMANDTITPESTPKMEPTTEKADTTTTGQSEQEAPTTEVNGTTPAQ